MINSDSNIKLKFADSDYDFQIDELNKLVITEDYVVKKIIPRIDFSKFESLSNYEAILFKGRKEKLSRNENLKVIPTQEINEIGLLSYFESYSIIKLKGEDNLLFSNEQFQIRFKNKANSEYINEWKNNDLFTNFEKNEHFENVFNAKLTGNISAIEYINNLDINSSLIDFVEPIIYEFISYDDNLVDYEIADFINLEYSGIDNLWTNTGALNYNKLKIGVVDIGFKFENVKYSSESIVLRDKKIIINQNGNACFYYHGDVCSQIIAGIGKKKMFRGVCEGATIVPASICEANSLNNLVDQLSIIIEKFGKTGGLGVHIISISMTAPKAPCNSLLLNSIDNLSNARNGKGIPIIWSIPDDSPVDISADNLSLIYRLNPVVPIGSVYFDDKEFKYPVNQAYDGSGMLNLFFVRSQSSSWSTACVAGIASYLLLSDPSLEIDSLVELLSNFSNEYKVIYYNKICKMILSKHHTHPLAPFLLKLEYIPQKRKYEKIIKCTEREFRGAKLGCWLINTRKYYFLKNSTLKNADSDGIGEYFKFSGYFKFDDEKVSSEKWFIIEKPLNVDVRIPSIGTFEQILILQNTDIIDTNPKIANCDPRYYVNRIIIDEDNHYYELSKLSETDDYVEIISPVIYENFDMRISDKEYEYVSKLENKYSSKNNAIVVEARLSRISKDYFNQINELLKNRYKDIDPKKIQGAGVSLQSSSSGIDDQVSFVNYEKFDDKVIVLNGDIIIKE